MKNHFLIQFNSFSAEISQLKSQLTELDPDWQEDAKTEEPTEQVPSHLRAANKDRETTREYAAKYDLDITSES